MTVAAAADEGAIRFAQRLAMTPSVSGQEGDAVAIAAEEMTRLGYRDVRIDDVGNCLGWVGNGEGPRLLIDGHIDTIPLHSSERWSVPPFGGVISGGRLYGLGICDQKASIAAAVYGVARAASEARLQGEVVLVASVNEEDLEGAALRAVVEAVQPTWAMVTEPSDTRLCIAQRGRAKLQVTVLGRACHAGHAAQGINAAEALACLISELATMVQPRHPRLGQRSITCIDLASSPYPSVSTVPGVAVAHLDCRLLPSDSVDDLLAIVERCAARAWKNWREPPQLSVDIVDATFSSWKGIRMRGREFQEAWETDEGHPLVRSARRGLAQAGLNPDPVHYSFCTNGSYLAGCKGIPTVGFGVGEEHMAHQVNESVALESIRAGVVGYAAIVRSLLGPDS